MFNISVTGVARYVGSHTCLKLLEEGFKVIVLDNLANSSIEALNRVQIIANRSLIFIHGDIRDSSCLDRIFKTHQIDAVIHFAGLKAVGGGKPANPA